MKWLAASLLALSMGAATAQDAPLSVVKVHEVADRTQVQLCTSARDWVAKTFRDSKAVIEVYDPAAGRIIGKGAATLSGWAGTSFTVLFTLQIDCKDGKYRTTFDAFQTQTEYGTHPLKEDSLNKLRTKAEARALELDTSLRTHLNSKPDDF